MQSGCEIGPDAVPIRYRLLSFAHCSFPIGPQPLESGGTLLDPQSRRGL
jgi:hypothetical protein